MARYERIACLGVRPSDNDNRMLVSWVGPDGVRREYTVNQRTLKRYSTATEIKTAIDSFTSKSFGYVLSDLWIHKNRNGTWSIAVGVTQPPIWPEDEVRAE